MGWLDARAEIDSLSGWWADAGVDVVIDEMPRNWLSESAPKTGAKPAVVEAAVVTAPAELPATREAFHDWWMSDTDRLGPFPPRRRVGPSGPVGAALMVVADMPEAGDVDQGRLLSGESGELFDKMLAAMKIGRDAVYIATLAPARVPSGILDAESAAELAPILLRHIALAAPQKLWLLGNAASRAVLGMDAAQAGGRLHSVNQDGRTVAAIATLHPAVLLQRPNLKGRVWEDMKRLDGELA